MGYRISSHQWKKNTAFDVANISDRILIEIDGGLHPFWRKFPDGSKMKVIKAGHSTAEE